MASLATAQEIKLAPLFTDNLVLQQASFVNIWGTAKPGEKITISGSWEKLVSTVANETGKWSVKLETPVAGGPYTLSIKGSKNKIELNNILIGEVWICSGQSNMEMPLKGWPPRDTIEGSTVEIPQAKNSYIRYFNVQRAFSANKEFNCSGSWQEATPETSAEFSATAYFFGKKLYSELQVPIGLINSSWGGTAAEAWTSAEALGAYPDFSNVVKTLPNLDKEQDNYIKWLEAHEFIDISSKPDASKYENLDLKDAICSKPETDDSLWSKLALPHGIENSEIGDFDGTIWFRKWIDVPGDMLKGDIQMILPGIDDMDQVWVNGVKVGSTEQPGFWQTPRNYTFSSSILRPNKNLVAIRITDNQGGGGIWDEKLPMEIRCKLDSTKTVSLKGEYKYMVVSQYISPKFYLLDSKTREWENRPKMSTTLGTGTPTALFNAMINPLVPYTFKGVIWYQGETNVGRGKQYQTLFPLMIKSWRDTWRQGSFPFYFVQICPWHYNDNKGSASAEIRNAQRLTLNSCENTGMVVTLDIGDTNNIHPMKKKPVGDRLALWALAKNYDKNMTFSGPLYSNKIITGNKIILEFTNADSGLKINDNTNNQFEIAGSDSIFMPAQVVVYGNKIMVSNSNITKPLKVRYAFRNTSTATLFNGNGLPASTFETE